MASNLKSMLSVATRSTGFNANAWSPKPLVRPATATVQPVTPGPSRSDGFNANTWDLKPPPLPIRIDAAWTPNATPGLQTTILGPGVTVQPVVPAAQPTAQPVATPASYPQASSPPEVVTQPIAPVMAPEVPAGAAPAKSGTGTLLAAAGAGFLVGGPIGAVIGAGAGYFLSKR